MIAANGGAGRIGFLFALDIDWSEKTKSGFIPAERHFGSGQPPALLGDKLFGDLRIAGAISALRIGLIGTLVVPGKDEKRRPGTRVLIDGDVCPPWQGWAIREMLVRDHGIDPQLVRWIPSTDGKVTEPAMGEGNSAMAAVVMRRYADGHPDLFPDGRPPLFLTNLYHKDRVCHDLVAAGFENPEVLSAESLILVEAYKRSRQEGDARRKWLAVEMSDPDYAIRMVNDLGGLAEKIAGTYDSSCNRSGWN